MSAAFEACFGRARALRASGQLEAALAAYEAALVVQPDSVAAQFNRANALQALGRHEAAVAAYDALLAFAADDAEALNNRAVSLAALGRPAEALASCEAALALRPAYVEALNNRGNALAALGRIAEGLQSMEQALALQPDLAAALSSRGRVLERAGRPDEALAAFEAALLQRPDDAESLCDCGNALQAVGRYAEALACFDRAVTAAARPVEALTNRGNVLQALGRHGEALDSYARAAALSPADPEILWNQALAYLALGDYARGWPLYEWRWRLPALGLAPRASQRPQWRGTPGLRGHTVLLHAEQGFGDAIQFVRHAGELHAQGARVLVACAPALQALFARADGVAGTVAPEAGALPAYDLHAPLMSLPLALGTTLQTIPRPPYLHADPARTAAWRARLDGPGLRIGVAWSGNPEFTAARLKACPPGLLARLTATSGCRFVSLQLGAARQQLGELGPGVMDAAPELASFDDSAALVAALDLVISIDTAVAHLAGALDKPVWILLPFAADWRWLVGRSDSPWYPSARLYRQSTPGAWEPVIAQVERDLQAWRNDGRSD